MSKKSPWEIYKEKNCITALDIVNPMTKKTDEEASNARYLICLACPELINLTKQCKQCGCFMKIKTQFEDAKCPLGKW